MFSACALSIGRLTSLRRSRCHLSRVCQIQETSSLLKRCQTPFVVPVRFLASYEDADVVKIPIPEIPKEKLDIKFVKASSGPGGQNVNKLNTKAEVRFKPKEADWIPKVMIDRFLELNASKINKDGEMVITSIRHRLQAHNLKDCLDKLREYLEEAAIIPKERIATEMPQYAKEKRLFDKKKRSDVKRSRQSSGEW